MNKIIDYTDKRKLKPPPLRTWKDIERVALRGGLTINTVHMLADQGFGSIKALRDMTEDDLEVLPLYAGQQLALSRLIDHVNTLLEGYHLEEEEKVESTVEKEEQVVDEAAKRQQEEIDEKEKQEILERINKQGLLADEEEHEGELGLSQLPRAHDFIVGKMSAKELTLEEFIYGNLLILEYFFEQKPSEVRASMKHIRFLLLKLLHGYPLDYVINYDYALRKKMEIHQTHMPKEVDEELMHKHLMMMTKKIEATTKKTKKPKEKKVKETVEKPKKKKTRSKGQNDIKAPAKIRVKKGGNKSDTLAVNGEVSKESSNLSKVENGEAENGGAENGGAENEEVNGVHNEQE